MDGWIQDFKYACRSILRAKRLSAVVIVTLALGLGANTAVFGVLNAVVLQPLPYDEPDRLVRIYQFSGGESGYMPGPAVAEFRQQSRTLDLAAVYTYAPEGVDLTDRPQPERVRMLPVSADYFRVLRVQPQLGRFFERADERDASRVAVISARVWRGYLAGAPDAVGKVLSMDGTPHRIAAVVPDGFDDPIEPGVDIWTPIDLKTDARNSWGNYYLSAIARLKPGVTPQQAQAELATIAASLPWNTAQTTVPRSARVAPLQADTVGTAGQMLWLLLGAVGLLLIIACVNVASLSLARGAARESDLAVRSALGGSRWRLVRPLLIESVVLSSCGGLAGLALARVVARSLLVVAPEAISRASDGVESVVVGFGVILALLCGIGFGVAPALQLTGAGLDSVLRESARGGSGSRRLTRTRNVLVVSQIALALVLLIGAGLLLRSFDRLRSVALGVQPADAITFEVHLPSGRYDDAARRARFHRDFQDRLAALPGVRAAGSVSRLPVTGSYHRWGTSRVDVPPSPTGVQPEQRVIEGRYFEALRIPLLRGRTFGPEDDDRAPRRVVVSQELVRRMFGDDEAIGRHLRVIGENVEIIGVVGDVAISARGLVRPMVYHAHRQFAANRNWALTQVVALDRVVPSTLDQIRSQLAAIDPSLVLYEPRMLADVIGGGVAQERFAVWLVAGFAALALALAAVGVYGVLNYAVTRRRREMGIRLALGASAGAVRVLIVRDGIRLAAAGVVLGLCGAFALTRTLRSLLFEVSATEPAVFGAGAVTLLAVALVASWIPARAATRVDPLHAVRAEP